MPDPNDAPLDPLARAARDAFLAPVGQRYVTAATFVPMTLAPLTPAQEAERDAVLERTRAQVDTWLREHFVGGGVGSGRLVR